MNSTTPDQSRTPELPEAEPFAYRVRSIFSSWHTDDTITSVLREYGRACVAAAMAAKAPTTFTTGHCDNRKQAGGCQLHNLQCGYPKCDQRPAAPPPDVQEAEPVAVTSSDMSPAFMAEAVMAAVGAMSANGLGNRTGRLIEIAAQIRRLTKTPSGDAEDARRWEVTPMVDRHGISEAAFRMDAYYYSFNPTGVKAIDMILSAVACAGKAFHYTEDWGVKCSPYEGHRGECPIEWIQNAAIDAAMLAKGVGGG